MRDTGAVREYTSGCSSPAIAASSTARERGVWRTCGVTGVCMNARANSPPLWNEPGGLGGGGTAGCCCCCCCSEVRAGSAELMEGSARGARSALPAGEGRRESEFLHAAATFLNRGVSNRPMVVADRVCKCAEERVCVWVGTGGCTRQEVCTLTHAALLASAKARRACSALCLATDTSKATGVRRGVSTRSGGGRAVQRAGAVKSDIPLTGPGS